MSHAIIPCVPKASISSGSDKCDKILPIASGLVITAIISILPLHCGHFKTSKSKLLFNRSAQGIYEVDGRQVDTRVVGEVCNTASSANWSDGFFAIFGFCEAFFDDSSDVAHGSARSRRGTINLRHLAFAASTPWYRSSGLRGGATIEAILAIASIGVITLCVLDRRIGYLVL
jgi:hypothetical protein